MPAVHVGFWPSAGLGSRLLLPSRYQLAVGSLLIQGLGQSLGFRVSELGTLNTFKLSAVEAWHPDDFTAISA